MRLLGKARGFLCRLGFTQAGNLQTDGLRFLPGAVYDADPLRTKDLEAEIGFSKNAGSNFATEYGSRTGNCVAFWKRGFLYYVEKPPPSPVFWFRNLWEKPFCASFSSIKEAASILRSVQRNWALSMPEDEAAHINAAHLRGRARLIMEALPFISQKRRSLDFAAPAVPCGAWTLLSANTLLASASCASPFPGGIIEYIEDKNAPPSRAYLKIAECFSRIGIRPRRGERCLDLGASPGGWTWFLSTVCADEIGAPLVTAIDRAPLDERVSRLPNVTFIKHDVFTIKPQEIGAIDWLFCDAACYPARTRALAENWLSAGLCRNFVCTIKMQGVGDMESARALVSIPGSRLFHLYHNKHELTWIKTSAYAPNNL